MYAYLNMSPSLLFLKKIEVLQENPKKIELLQKKSEKKTHVKDAHIIQNGFDLKKSRADDLYF